MIHFIYLLLFALFISACFGVFSSGTTTDRLWYAGKMFVQFVGISLIIAWVLYFVPW